MIVSLYVYIGWLLQLSLYGMITQFIFLLDIEWRWSNGESIGKGNTSTNVNSYKKSSFLQFSVSNPRE